ncbi:uncharacterized protein LOC130520970 [Takifugu flavidus]|uniref:uncharacterized protein LOC130520970 n=1 Tax=Takifugu flavidus TaxID=433684 RepID=UPI0025440527|nr:uncharacterized protein LOC130520970 [Takifugu flavidus]XP_056880625.1 uncharacterized protein LOC130520970 [Takifugu flavidus]
MDPSHSGEDMSPLYVLRKKKCVKSQSKSGEPCPASKRMPQRTCELNSVGLVKNDEPQSHEPLKMKRPYGKKRFNDLATEAVDHPTSSCSVKSSGGLSNGTDPGSMAPPTPRLSPRLRAKNVWTQGPETSKKQHLPQGKNCNIRKDRRNPVATGGDQTQDQMWNSGRDRVGHFPPDQTWIPGRSQEQDGVETVWVVCQEQGPVEDWVSDGDEGHNQVGVQTEIRQGVRAPRGQSRSGDPVKTRTRTLLISKCM